ncbi:Euchromatic histone-lysine N-methyltransferase 1 [Hyphodiscus hymeniophilus]|uniref:Euchromatic histone-lysine N-methyltransferase 1 n=1 Tax=Hyphodiscus hymeniophilus TaxID=353542 RepID=A0A9P6VE03_9HELO|nr:Euchromatic histone-lysine N-methyltransferase 1 [Hyphodiscus hymeniophilus]
MPPPRSGPGPLPRNWPTNSPYIVTPVYSKSLSSSHDSSLRTRPSDAFEIPANSPRGPCQLVRVTPIANPSHPANGQSGLFATKDLKPGTFILQYLGEIHASPTPSFSTQNSNADPHAHSDYDLSLDREHGIGIDAAKMGNEARFTNDYRGIAEKPNAEFREIWDGRKKERGMAVCVLGEGKSGKGKGIRKGEEILVSYGRGFWGARRADDENTADV